MLVAISIVVLTREILHGLFTVGDDMKRIQQGHFFPCVAHENYVTFLVLDVKNGLSVHECPPGFGLPLSIPAKNGCRSRVRIPGRLVRPFARRLCARWSSRCRCL